MFSNLSSAVQNCPFQGFKLLRYYYPRSVNAWYVQRSLSRPSNIHESHISVHPNTCTPGVAHHVSTLQNALCFAVQALSTPYTLDPKPPRYKVRTALTVSTLLQTTYKLGMARDLYSHS
jgi:hypothetical protein